MENQWIRTELLLGEEAVERLKNSRVAVFGVYEIIGRTRDDAAGEARSEERRVGKEC